MPHSSDTERNNQIHGLGSNEKMATINVCIQTSYFFSLRNQTTQGRLSCLSERVIEMFKRHL